MESDTQTHDTQSYMCLPLSEIGKSHLEAGNKIIMPVSAFSSSYQTLFCQMTFRIATSTLHYHCGVAEFTADEGLVFLPMWMMKKLKLRECDIVNIQNTCLPEGKYIKVQPNTTKFIALSDHKSLLKKTVRDNFTCLTTNDTIVVNHNDNKYLIHIVETKPSCAIYLSETDDYEVEFVTPLDFYKQPHRAILQEDEWTKKIKPFNADDHDQMVNFNMPDDIIRNILERLPTKPLLQCRCVSTHWNRLITDPDFMKSKLRRKILRRKILLVSRDFHAIEDKGPLGHDVVKLRHPNFYCLQAAYDTKRDIRILGTFDGIVVFVVNHYTVAYELKRRRVSFTSHIVFYNPFTGASEMFPDPYSPFKHNDEHRYGFGYGATKDELKIVRFRDRTEPPLYNWNTCDVFNLKERSWSTSSDIVIKSANYLDHVGTFVNGFLYWFAVTKIVALDVKEMVISEICLPVTCINTKSHFTHLGTLHGRLSMITYTEKPFEFNMWTMKTTEQGVKNSWSETRLLTLDSKVRGRYPNDRRRVISLMDDGRVLIQMMRGATNDGLIIYDTSNYSYKILWTSQTYIKTINVNAIIEYDESLVVPSII